MARHRPPAGALYYSDENMSEATTCSCTTKSVDKCSVRSCGMFHEPFFLHPPGSRPRDGIYINPMSPFIEEPGGGPGQKQPSGESFYLHSPHDLVYTRITHLFCADNNEKSRNADRALVNERKDETLTVKVDVHINKSSYNKSVGNGRNSMRSDSIKGSAGDSGSSGSAEHAYEQISIRPPEHQEKQQESGGGGGSVDCCIITHKKINDDISESNRSSSAGSESSNMSSELHCFSASTASSTPSLSRNASNERVAITTTTVNNNNKTIIDSTEVQSFLIQHQHNNNNDNNGPVMNDGQHRSIAAAIHHIHNKFPITEPTIISMTKPPPPPPPLPPPPAPSAEPEATEDLLPYSGLPINDAIDRDHQQQQRTGDVRDAHHQQSQTTAANKSEVLAEQQPEVEPGSASSDSDESKQSLLLLHHQHQLSSHLVTSANSRHMVLPFIPPKFANITDSDTLLKPSEYLRSICKTSLKNNLSKARSVDNLDIRRRTEVDHSEEEEEEEEEEDEEDEEEGEEENDNDGVENKTRRNNNNNSGGGGGKKEGAAVVGGKKSLEESGPPPPPLPPYCCSTNETGGEAAAAASGGSSYHQQEAEIPKTPQPLATISIQDLTSVQLRRTNVKMHATKTFSAPPPRSVSMTNVSEPFFVQKTDLIAELKKTKDIPGIKKLKVERAKSEKTLEQNMITEISKAFSVSNFVDQIPEKDSSGNVIPIWKRQMLARKAAERAKKELEEQIARENEEKRQKAIPPWKRQLLAKKDSEERKGGSSSAASGGTGTSTTPVVVVPTAAVKIEMTPIGIKRDMSPASGGGGGSRLKPVDFIESRETEENKSSVPAAAASCRHLPIRDDTKMSLDRHRRRHDEQQLDDPDDLPPIIPWRAQLRKTNSKLNIID